MSAATRQGSAKSVFSRIHPVFWLFGLSMILPFFTVPVLGLTVALTAEVLIFGMFALAYNLLLGYTGLNSFGHVAYFGFGAYAAALVQIHWTHDMILATLIGTLLTALFGAGVGALVIRHRGLAFSLLTVAFQQMLFTVVFRWTSLTGGENGLSGIKRYPVLGLDLSDQVVYYYVVTVICAGFAYAVWRLVHSPFGHALQAIRENEVRAASLGYDTRRYKYVVWVISCALSGFAGALYAYAINFIYSETIHWSSGGNVVIMAVVGGMRAFFGPFVGSLIFVILRDFFSSLTKHWMLVFGAIFVMAVLFLPQGIVGLFRGRLGRRKRSDTPASQVAVGAMPALDGDGAAAVPEAIGARRPYDMNAPMVLEARGLTRRFGAFIAVGQVNLHVRKGYLHSLIGPNGAGKTTLFHLLAGSLECSEGAVLFEGTEITSLLPHQRADLGMSRSFQILSIFKELSAYENIRIAVQARFREKRFSLWQKVEALEEINAEARRILDLMGLADKAEAEADLLSHGDQRLLEIGISLATNPRLLLLDEPFAGLSAEERTFIAPFIRKLADGERTVLLIEHDIDRVLAISDRLSVLHRGEIIAEGSPEEIPNIPQVQEAYLGGYRAALTAAPPRATAGAESAAPLLGMKGVNTFYGKSHTLHGINLEVREGEVVALLGRNGAGKTTTLKTLMGAVPPSDGEIVFKGQRVTGLASYTINKVGIGIVPEGRRIFPNLTVEQNLMMGYHDRAGGVKGEKWDLDRVYEFFPKLRILRERKGDVLSGGERQMVAIGRALLGNVDLLLLDEPFEGLAPAVVADIVQGIERMRGSVSMLLVEHNADLTLGVSDRAYVMVSGAIVWGGDASALREDEALQQRLLGI